MFKLKQYFAVIVGLILAGGAVTFHVLVAWPPGLDAMSKSERDLMMMEPSLETCAVFFTVLRRSASWMARWLGVLARGQELIIDTQGNARMTEIMAALLVILFRGVFRIHPGPITPSDWAMIGLAGIIFVVNVRETVMRKDGLH